MQPKTIAIVHGDRGLAETLAEMTQQLGYKPIIMTVNETTKPEEVYSFIYSVNPALVFLAENYRTRTPIIAYTLPQEIIPQSVKIGEGIEALVEIRKNRPTLPVVIVSGNPLHYDKAMQNGANGYLPMPIEFTDYKKLLKSNIQS